MFATLTVGHLTGNTRESLLLPSSLTTAPDLIPLPEFGTEATSTSVRWVHSPEAPSQKCRESLVLH